MTTIGFRIVRLVAALPFLICIFLPITAVAQQEVPPEGVSNRGALYSYVTEDEVHLRWNSPLEQEYRGFQIERREAGRQEWLRLTDEPVTRVTEVEEIRRLLGNDADSFLTFFDPALTDIDDAAFGRVAGDAIARSMIQLVSVGQPALGFVLGERYSDSRLQPGESFDYRVVMITPSGSEMSWAQTDAPVTHGQVDSIPVPQNLEGKGEEESALLNWRHDAALSRSGRCVSYRVYRSEKAFGPFVPASIEAIIPVNINNEAPEFLFADRFLVNGTSYWYRVTGMDVLGFESEPSAAIEIVPRDRTPPPAPAEIEVRLMLEKQGLLEWQPVEADDLRGYNVYRALATDGPFDRIWPGEGAAARNRLSHLDDSINEGDIYWYYVTAEDTSGNESLPSDKVQLFRPDVTPPAAPQLVEAVANQDGDGIVLHWVENDEADLAGYLVQRTTRISGRGSETEVEDRFFLLNSDPLTVSTYTDPVSSTSQSRYAYRIVAVDNASNNSEPSEIVIARMPDKVAPVPPALYSAVLEEGAVVLRWQKSVEEDLAGYRIYRAASAPDKDSESFALVSTPDIPPDATQFSDNPGEIDTVFLYRITAIDTSNNESEPSATLGVRYLDTKAPKPPGLLQLKSEDKGLRLSWQSSDDQDISFLLLYRKAGSRDQALLWAELKPGITDFLDASVKEKEKYSYFLCAVDKAGNISVPSQEIAAEYRKPEKPDAE
ncbi:MAG: hypothetical protein JXR49_11295 [Acidobacteria bacterium]|nr:hypothetical protein [Acidobacteriota bacterium]